MSFLQRLQSSLESLCSSSLPAPAKIQYVIAYSGGVDSHVLLHCCHKLRIPVRAVHVHHGLQSIADDWVFHCKKTCEELNIPLAVIHVDATKKTGQSPEESARIERYSALHENLTQGEYLLTAQHVNDQAETFLLQLFRAASSAGLAAMPAFKRFGNSYHLRPLLAFSRQDIENYAIENSLHWMEDPSNADNSFDRNFIRNKLLPVLKQRWPTCVEQLATAADLQSSNLQVMEDMAAIDLAQAVVVPEQQLSHRPDVSQQRAGQWNLQRGAYDVVSILSISVLKQLSTARLLNVLRYWAKQTARKDLDITLNSKLSLSRKVLHEIEKTLVNSRQDASPVILFSGYEYRRYRNNLYRLKQKMQITLQAQDLQWNPAGELFLPTLNRHIRAVVDAEGGLRTHLLDEALTFSFRQGGEKFHPVNRKHSHSLKKLYQEANIPPWERDAIPLLYWRGELIAVVGLWLSKHHVVDVGERGWSVELKGM